MSILGRNTDCVPTPCGEGNYMDKSLYLDDATVLLSAVNAGQLKNAVGEQLLQVYKTAHDNNATAEEFYEMVCKLQTVAKIHAQVDRLKNQSK